LIIGWAVTADVLNYEEEETMRKALLFCIVLLLSFSIMGLMGCGEEAEEDEEKKDVSGPSVFNTIPKNKAKNVPTTAAILVVFSREIMTPSNANLTFTPAVTGDVS
jgi:ABC-type oligopeptide transport system substrate-binding subunit